MVPAAGRVDDRRARGGGDPVLAGAGWYGHARWIASTVGLTAAGIVLIIYHLTGQG